MRGVAESFSRPRCPVPPQRVGGAPHSLPSQALPCIPPPPCTPGLGRATDLGAGVGKGAQGVGGQQVPRPYRSCWGERGGHPSLCPMSCQWCGVHPPICRAASAAGPVFLPLSPCPCLVTRPCPTAHSEPGSQLSLSWQRNGCCYHWLDALLLTTCTKPEAPAGCPR